MNSYKQLKHLIGTYNNITNVGKLTKCPKTNKLHVLLEEQACMNGDTKKGYVNV